MSNDEAKFLLSAYRPGGHDAADPAMAEALAHTRQDPVLAAWFRRQQAHDAAIAARLREIAPPPGLREAILAGGRASGGAPAKPRWRQPIWIAAAAALAVLLSLAAWWRFAPVRGASLEAFAVNVVDRGFRLQKHSADLAVLKAWLAERRGPLPDALPAEFARLRALGCRRLDFRGREVSLVCFERGGREFHVFVARRPAGEGEEERASAAPRFIDRGSLVAAAWADAQQRYVVVSDAGMEALRRLF